jgi:hypothetical protein
MWRFLFVMFGGLRSKASFLNLSIPSSIWPSIWHTHKLQIENIKSKDTHQTYTKHDTQTNRKKTLDTKNNIESSTNFKH